MSRLILFLAVWTMLGCSASGGLTGEASNRYEYAANSWLGARIEEMVATWGTPNSGYIPPEPGKHGVAGWNAYSVSGSGDDKSYRYRCTTLAYFDSNGLITRIVVKHSRSCDRRYGDEFGTMTRREPRSDHMFERT